MEEIIKDCSNCKHKYKHYTEAPCYGCILKGAYGGVYYTKWKQRTIWQKLMEGLI